MSDNPTEARQAFDQLIGTLREVADRFCGSEWDETPDDVAGGLRVLAHLLEGGLVGYFEDDPRQPVFRQIVTSTRKSLGDNADACFISTAPSIHGSLSCHRPYRRSGLCVLHRRGRRRGRRLSEADRRCDQRTPNSTSIPTVASRSSSVDLPALGNRIGLDDDATRITSRHYFEEEQSPAAPPIPDLALAIEVLDPVEPLPAPSDSSVAVGWRRVERYVRSRSLEQTKPGEGEQPPFVSREIGVFPPPVPPGDHAPRGVRRRLQHGALLPRAGRGADHDRKLAGVSLCQRLAVEPPPADLRFRPPPGLAQPGADPHRSGRAVPYGYRPP